MYVPIVLLGFLVVLSLVGVSAIQDAIVSAYRTYRLTKK